MKNHLFLLFTGLFALSVAYSAPALHDVSLKEMGPARCLAASRIKDTSAPGGFAPSGNLPRPLEEGSRGGQNVYLQVNSTQIVPLQKTYKGLALFLVNPTDTPKAFSASDSCLPIIQEALDRKGQWRPIEFLYGTTCGNSYHQVFLDAHEYWAFTIPRYKGVYATKLRFRFTQGTNTLLSNEFHGSINPDQFKKPKDAYKIVMPLLPS